MRVAGIVSVTLGAMALWLVGPASSRPAFARQGDSDREKAEGAAPRPSDTIDAAIEKSLHGKASLGDVRVEASWSRNGKASSIRIYGSGIVICDGKLQFSVNRTVVVGILTGLRKARFGSMPDQFGEMEGGEKDESPRLRGRVAVRIGATYKSVLQLVDGEQSAELEALAGTILAVCHGAAEKGTGAESLANGLQKLNSGALAPEVLDVTLQRRAKAPDQGSSEEWILRLEGRQVTSSLLSPGRVAPPPRRFLLSETDFRALTKLLADEDVGGIPINVYTPEYTDLSISLLNRSRLIAGRRFLQMTPETHGEKQKAFDRIYEALRALHERVQKEGKKVRPAAPSPTAAKKPSENEREAQEERARERDREKRKPTPVPSSSTTPAQGPR